MGVQVPCRVLAVVRQEAAVWANQAATGDCISRTRRKECKIEEGHLMPDHVHILISILPKYSVAEVIGYLKGKALSGLRRTWSASCAIFSATSSGRVVISFRPLAGTRR